MFEHIYTAGAPGWQLIFQLAWGLLLTVFVALVVALVVAPRSKNRLARSIAGRSLRTSLLVSTALVGILPALTTAILLAERSASARYEQIASRLTDTAGAAAAEVELFIDKHRAAVVSASRVIGAHEAPGDETLFRWLSMYHDIYSDFLTMLSAGSNGDIRSATILLDGAPVAVARLEGQNVADRPYFIRPMADGGSYVSDVFRGRGLGNDPIVAVSAALVDANGERFGIVEGSLNLRAFSRIERNVALMDEALMLILDEQQRVIYSGSSSEFRLLEAVGDQPQRTGLASEADLDGDGVYETDRYVTAQAFLKNGWSVVIRVPGSVIQQQTNTDYGLAAFLIMLAIVVALTLAGLAARRMSRALASLNESIDDFTLEGDGANFRIPAGTPAEFRPVLEHMRSRSKHLRATHDRLTLSLSHGEQLTDQLERAISDKEAEISHRTRELEAANKRLEDLSRRDGLTGIANRRGYDQFEAHARQLCQREGTPMAIIMIDIDFFKQFNDLNGHGAGDDCLRRVAQALEKCAQRPLDLVARFGGEEFVAVLGATRIASAVIVAERMRLAVLKLGIHHSGSSEGIVSISVGVAGIAAGEATDTSRIRQDADRALYAAKSQGRNAVFYAVGNESCRYDEQAIISDTAIHQVRSVQQG